MRTLIMLTLFCTSWICSAQPLEMTIQSNREVYDRYSQFNNDTIYITYKIKNTGEESMLLRIAREFFELEYLTEERYSWEHCFRIYPDNNYRYFNKDYGHRSEDFVWIYAGEEITRTEPFSIGWTCRGSAPEAPWDFKLYFKGGFKTEDNYVLYKSDYSENYLKEFIDGWTGTLKSNEVKITLK